MVHQPATAVPWIVIALVAFIVPLGTSELVQAPVTADVLVLGAGWAVIIAGGLTRRAAIGRVRDTTTELRCACVRSRI